MGRTPLRVLRALPVATLIPVLLVACGNDADEQIPTAPASDSSAETDPVSPSDGPVDEAGAVSAVDAFDPDQPETIHDLNEIYRRDGDVVAALAEFFDDADRDRRWAAVYVAALVTDTDEEAEVLARAVADTDPAIRVIAAGSLIGLGRVEALPVLVEALEMDSSLVPFTGDDVPASGLAGEALATYTDQDFDEPAAWRSWLADALPRLMWNGEIHVEG